MPRETTVLVYKFSELSPQAKERAKNDHMATTEFSDAEEAMASIRKLAEHFGGKVSDYSIDWGGGTPSSMDFEMPEDVSDDEVKAKLDELGGYNPETFKGHGDSVLTGFGTDEDAIDGFRIAWHKGVRGLDKLMEAAYESWLAAAQSEYAAQYEDENFSDFCDGNDYEFYKNGKRA